MLERLESYPEDTILSLMGRFRADPRPDKLDLGVGVYRDARGRTPVLRAVKAAEQVIWETQASKVYTGLAGDPAFAAAMRDLVLGAAAPADRVAAAATPGGTGAIRMAFDLWRVAATGGAVWLPDPTWPNHVSIVGFMGLPLRRFRYYDRETGDVDRAGLLEDLGGARVGDLVVLHGCCHNPTGADPTPEGWGAIAEVLGRTGAVPLIDLAYHGFGDGLNADAAGTRGVVERLPEALVAVSCSKTFGLYRERTGVLLATAPDPALRDRTQAAMEHLARQTYSFPPDHGARVVSTILETPNLRAEWEAELGAMRHGLNALRRQLSDELRQRTNSDRFDRLARQRGMFSRLPATPEQMALLRERHGIYAVGDGRINVAGLAAESVPRLAAAIAEVGL